MILGIGIDVIEVERLRAAVERHGRRLLERLYTRAELDACALRADPLLSLAARFAAKEAAIKALGGGGIFPRQIELLGGDGSPPRLLLHAAAGRRARELGVRGTHCSLTHQPRLAAAVVVLEA